MEKKVKLNKFSELYNKIRTTIKTRRNKNHHQLYTHTQHIHHSNRQFIYINECIKDGLILPSLILEIIRLQHTTW